MKGFLLQRIANAHTVGCTLMLDAIAEMSKLRGVIAVDLSGGTCIDSSKTHLDHSGICSCGYSAVQYLTSTLSSTNGRTSAAGCAGMIWASAAPLPAGRPMPPPLPRRQYACSHSKSPTNCRDPVTSARCAARTQHAGTVSHRRLCSQPSHTAS